MDLMLDPHYMSLNNDLQLNITGHSLCELTMAATKDVRRNGCMVLP